MVENNICYSCGSYLRQVISKTYEVYQGSCSCPTGECTCGVHVEWYCPRCQPSKNRPNICFFPPQGKKEEEEDKLIVPEGAPWLGDKKSRQRERSKWSAKGSICTSKKRKK